MSLLQRARAPRAGLFALSGLWMTARHLLLPLALGFAAGTAAASAVEKLQRGDELVCEPAWPFFCSNFHVACAGQTTVRAFAFTLRATGAHATLATGDDADGVAEGYARARVAYDAPNRSVLLLPASTNGYLNLQADGRYSFRHDLTHRGIMSLGRCQ